MTKTARDTVAPSLVHHFYHHNHSHQNQPYAAITATSTTKGTSISQSP